VSIRNYLRGFDATREALSGPELESRVIPIGWLALFDVNDVRADRLIAEVASARACWTRRLPMLVEWLGSGELFERFSRFLDAMFADFTHVVVSLDSDARSLPIADALRGLDTRSPALAWIAGLPATGKYREPILIGWGSGLTRVERSQDATEPAPDIETGIAAALTAAFPIKHEPREIEASWFELVLMASRLEPLSDVVECRERGWTWAAAIMLDLRVVRCGWTTHAGSRMRSIVDVSEESVFLGELPLLTDDGTFVVDGHRRPPPRFGPAPGVSFGHDGERWWVAIQPQRGARLEIELDARGFLRARIDDHHELPATLLLRACSVRGEWHTTEELRSYFYDGEDADARLGPYLRDNLLADPWHAASDPEAARALSLVRMLRNDRHYDLSLEVRRQLAQRLHGDEDASEEPTLLALDIFAAVERLLELRTGHRRLDDQASTERALDATAVLAQELERQLRRAEPTIRAALVGDRFIWPEGEIAPAVTQALRAIVGSA
jgi:hypothetical protein